MPDKKKNIAFVFWFPAILYLIFIGAGLIELGPLATFNAIMRLFAQGAFYLGYALGILLAYSLRALLPRWIQASMGGFWIIFTFFIHPFTSLGLAYLFTLPFRAWM